MPPVWLRAEASGAWAYFPSVADATAHLGQQGIGLFATEVSRAAKNGKTRNGWEFRSTSPYADVPSLPATSEDMVPDSGQRQGGVLTFFTPASELAACGCCGEKLLGDIVSCPGCGQQVHALCTQGAKCFRCVCRVCNSPPRDAMRPCKSCKHRVHVACTVQVPYRAEVTCKVSAPKPRLSPRPRKKQVKRRFNPQGRWAAPVLPLSYCATVHMFTDVITQDPRIKDKTEAEPAIETHVSQGMTVCAYCVTVSFCHCVTASLCHPPPHRVMCWYIHEIVAAPCVHTCITWSLCHCVPLHCPQMPSVEVMNMDTTALGSGGAPMPTMPT